jgi:GTP cyclohydrolase I
VIDTTAETMIRRFLLAIGEDPRRPGLVETPGRVVRAWRELLAGYGPLPRMTSFETNVDEMVIVRGIEATSICEHHLLPFTCRVTVGYLPAGRVLGLSKIPRLVEHYARRLQLQERLTHEIANAMIEAVQPAGVGVVITGNHLCARARGIKATQTSAVTSAMLGTFRSNASARAEFLALVRRDHEE